jgi:hypothetical protein
MANRLGTPAGESIPKVEEPSLRVEAPTPSLDGRRSFSAVMKAAQTKSIESEIRSLLKRAIEIDPKLALAYPARKEGTMNTSTAREAVSGAASAHASDERPIMAETARATSTSTLTVRFRSPTVAALKPR